MFGYVRPPQDLPEEELKRFGRAYCGLCHVLGERYGTAARFILNYDFTFLAILLSEREEGPIHHGRCAAHPVHGRDRLETSPALELAADESVILAYWQARDGVEDHDWFHGLKYRGASAVLERAYRRAARARPDFDASTRRQLDLLAELERESCPSMDRAADTFAMLLQGAAQAVDEPVRRRVLEQIFYHLGRWVYLVDAADDLAEDFASGSYNPLLCRFRLESGVLTEEARQALVVSLDHSIRLMGAAFELWDFGAWSPILRATIYEGLFCVGRAVLEGTFQASDMAPHVAGRNKEQL